MTWMLGKFESARSRLHYIDVLVGLDEEVRGMPNGYWNSNARYRDVEARQTQEVPRLFDELHLLGGIAVVEKIPTNSNHMICKGGGKGRGLGSAPVRSSAGWASISSIPSCPTPETAGNVVMTTLSRSEAWRTGSRAMRTLVVVQFGFAMIPG